MESALLSPPLGGPLYKEVKRRLLAALAAGDWRPGDAIPPEPELADRYSVSIGTLRKAVDELVAENILIRQQGRGTFVATHDRDRLLFHFFHVVREDGRKEYPQVDLVSFARGKASAQEAEWLRVAVAEPVLRLRNRLSLGGVPIIVDDLTLPARLFRGLTERRFARRPSTIYNLYQDGFGLSVVRTTERLRATLADADAARLLGIAPGTPLLQIRRIAYAYNNLAVELRKSRVDTRRHEYWSEIGRPA